MSGASGNLLNVFGDEADALAAVRQLEAANDAEYASALGLLQVDEPGDVRLVAEGSELQTRARGAADRGVRLQTPWRRAVVSTLGE